MTESAVKLPDIETSITRDESMALLKCIEGKHTVLEIGSAFGYSTILLAEPWRIVSRVVLSVDPHSDYNSWETFLENVERHSVSGRVLPFRATNKQILPYMGDNSVDAAFIDGDHSHEHCLYDILNCLRIVRPGGVLAVHDYCTITRSEGNDGNQPVYDSFFPGVRSAVDKHLLNYPHCVVGNLFIVEV